jgi:gliding motility-associated-like protein
MKLCRLFSYQGAFVVLLLFCFLGKTEAQNNSKTAYNAEALWSSYNHQAFHKEIQKSLGLSNADYDAFQKYLLLQKETWKDQMEFFRDAKKGIQNPLTINKYFSSLKAKYISYFPDFVNFRINQKLAGNTGVNPGILGCGAPCTNPGFETNDFTNWTQQQGKSISGLLTAGVSLSTGPAMTSITSPGPDPAGAPINQVYPGGGTHSAMIGDANNNGSNAGGLSTSFTVDATTTNFTYSYAVVLQDGGHSANDQPFFMLNLTDQNGTVLPCGSYEVTAGANIPNFFQVPGTFDQWYRPWTTMFVDLTPYIGQCVTMQFICRDCDQGGHYGYAYVDASCAPAQIVTSSPAICGSSSITLTAPPGASAYAWTGPGIVGPNNTQVITANVAGTYTVVMTSAQGGCTSTLHITIPGNPTSPIANFTSTPGCMGTPTSFTDLSKPAGGITAWAWDFNGDGVTDANTQNPSYTFPTAGTFPVHLTITWPPCVHDTIINVTVYPLPVPAFTATAVCVGTATSFTNTTPGATTSSWTFGDGTTSTTPNPTHIYPASGTYTATLVSTSIQGCVAQTQQIVTVNGAPAANFTAQEVCQGAATAFTNTSANASTYSWTFGDGGTSTLQNPTHTFATSGTYAVSLIAISQGGCTNTISIPVKVDPLPEADFTSNSVCIDAPTVFTDASAVPAPSSISQWAWDFGDGSTALTQNPSHIFTTAGTHTVQLITISNSKCSDTASKVITVYALPVVSFTGDSLTHCMPWCVNFKDASSVAGGTLSKWTWNFGDNTPPVIQTAAAPESHCYPKAGTYDVNLTVVSNEGCQSNLDKPAYITIWPLPEAAFSANPQPTSVLAPVVTLNDASTLAVAWHWNFGDGDTLGLQDPNPTHTYPSEVPGTYPVQLIVYSIHGCSDTTIGPVVIGPVFDFYAPNCFTPNNDGINDYFFGYGVGIDKYELIIVDRWGNQIWKTNELYQGWDGKVLGSSLMCQEDVYVGK